MLAALAALAASLLNAPPPEVAVARALADAPAGGARAALATRSLVGVPYAPDPLGEGAGPDPDPRFRLDAFDCMTLVETAVALGSATDLGEARRALDDVRYAGAPSRAGRNHEVLSQWIPENVRKGWVADVAEAAAGAQARRAEKEYTAASWAEVRRAGRLIAGLPRARLPLGRFGVGIVPPAAAPAAAARVPDGTIVFVVRADGLDRATRITHAGLVVHRADGAALVRHATSSKGVARVIEEPVERFLLRQERALPRWPVDGLAFLAIRDNRARLRELAAQAAPR